MPRESRSSRNSDGGRNDRLSALRALRQGASDAALPDNDDDIRLYDTVDEDTYHRMSRREQQEDDFVIDDDGRGYAGAGLSVVDSDEGSELEGSDAEEDNGRKRGRGSHSGPGSKRKKADSKDKNAASSTERPNKRITTLFQSMSAANAASASSPAAPIAAASTSTSSSAAASGVADAALQQMLADLIHNPGAASVSAPTSLLSATPTRKSKSSLADQALFGSSSRPTASPSHSASPLAPVKLEERAMPSTPTPARVSVPPTPAAPSPATPTPAVVAENAPAALPSAPELPSSGAKITPRTAATAQTLAPMVVPLTAAKTESSSPAVAALVNNTLKFFWTDAAEVNGDVYVFGRTPEGASTCIIVKNIERNMFFLPRTHLLDQANVVTDVPVTMGDVFDEAESILQRFGITTFASKSVRRKYAFDLPNIPEEAEYLKVAYRTNLAALPMDIKGKTFSHVFGTNTSAIELFLRKRRIMGPCWLEAHVVENDAKLSHCSSEYIAHDPKGIRVLQDAPPAPPLIGMSISLKTIVNPKTNANEIVGFALLVHRGLQMDGPSRLDGVGIEAVGVRPLPDRPLPYAFEKFAEQKGRAVREFGNERGLLEFLLANIKSVDPDVLVAHNLVGFDLDVLLHRIRDTSVGNWSRIGRLRRSVWPKLNTGLGDSQFAQKLLTSGRLLCDTQLGARDLVRQHNYSLEHLVESLLNYSGHVPVETEQVPSFFLSSDALLRLLMHAEAEAHLTMQLLLHLNFLPLTKQLTNIAGNLWNHTMAGSRAERNEYLLLHSFHVRKYICPDKTPPTKRTAAALSQPHAGIGEDEDENGGKTSGGKQRKGPAYAGGLVLDPKVGFYDKYVLVLDFNSLYPSIIQQYNICFTTVARSRGNDDDGETPMPELPPPDTPLGVLPLLLENLVQRRQVVKRELDTRKAAPHADPAELAQLDVRQQALKLTANSMYGCLGFAYSRFYAKPLAMLVTARGRDLLQKTVELAENKHQLQVIYGDTDSIMIFTGEDNVKTVKEMGMRVTRDVNQLYNKVKLGIDGLFAKMLLLKKKKYAAKKVVGENADGSVRTQRETKGLDLVRRDWCELAKDASSAVLDVILRESATSDEVTELIHEIMRGVAAEVRAGRVGIEKYIINKSLTKRLEDYPDAKNQPHVQVAMRMKSRGLPARQGDIIPYVICKSDDTSANMGSRAFHPDEVTRDSSDLQLDLDWYLKQQVLPTVSRLCEPIQGMHIAQLAECLGIETRGLTADTAAALENERKEKKFAQSDRELFASMPRWVPACPQCGVRTPFEGPVRRAADGSLTNGLVCTCGAHMAASLQVQAALQIRGDVRRYYENWVQCDDQQCRLRCRMASVNARRCFTLGCTGTMHPVYSDQELYKMISYFEFLFDEKRQGRMFEGGDAAHASAILVSQALDLAMLRRIPERFMKVNGRRFVNLGSIFQLVKA